METTTRTGYAIRSGNLYFNVTQGAQGWANHPNLAFRFASEEAAAGYIVKKMDSRAGVYVEPIYEVIFNNCMYRVNPDGQVYTVENVLRFGSKAHPVTAALAAQVKEAK